jgi:glycosyltransferase involved in cell wall biosynthesis
VKIAVYAIALNEAKHVARWAQATAGADIRIVADTGSTDNTVQLLNEHRIETYEINVTPFRFDDARNAALALVPTDVDICVSLDLDEVPDPDFFDKLREGWKPGVTRAWVFWDTKSRWMNNNRIHARHGYRWIKPCHEVTVQYPKPEHEHDIIIETVVKHVPDDSKPRSQYLPLLQMAVDEDPYDMRMRVYLIREYYFAKMWQEVIEEGRQLFTHERVENCWASELAAAYRGVGDAYDQLGDPLSARIMYEEGMDASPTEMEAVFPLAYWHYVNKDWQQCFDLASKVNELKPGGHYLVDESIYQWRAYDLLAISSWHLGKKGSAKKWARLAVEGNPEDKRLQDNYQFMLKGQNNGMS